MTGLPAAGRFAGLHRGDVAGVRMRLERAALPLVARPAPDRPRILCYHSVGTPAWGVNDVSPARFLEQIQAALQAGYTFVPPRQIASGRGLPGQLAVTFDDGLCSVATNAAPILHRLGIPWTVFVVTDWAEGWHGFGDGVVMDWRDLAGVDRWGGTVASHSQSHPDFGRLSADAALIQLEGSRRLLRQRLGMECDEFAVPFGQSANWTDASAAAARQAGYSHVYAQSEHRRPAGTVPRTFITRFDGRRTFAAALKGAFDSWEEWL